MCTMHKNRYFPDHTIIENVKTTIGHFVQHTFQFRIKHLTFFFFYTPPCAHRFKAAPNLIVYSRIIYLFIFFNSSIIGALSPIRPFSIPIVKIQ